MQNTITKKEALEFITDVTRAMNQNDEPEKVMDKILGACIHISAADSGSIMILKKDKQTMEIKASQGLSQSAERLRLKVGEGVTGWVARYAKPRLVDDASQEEDYISIKDGLNSELAVPMLVRDELIGVLSMDCSRKNAFTQEHQDFMCIMADLAARIFVNLQDNALLKLRDRFHRVMIEISRVVSRSLQLKDIFQEIMAIAEKSFRLHRSMLLLYSPEEDHLKNVAAVGLSQDELTDVSYKPGEGITGSVFENKRAVFIPNTREDPDFLNRMKFVVDTEDMGFFCSPIFSGSDVVGVFSTFIRTDHVEGTDPAHLMEFLEIVGSIISQAITIQKLVRDETRVITHENIQLKRQLSVRYQFGSLIGRSPIMLKLFDKVRIIADSRASVLLTGDSGTGKELIASAIHYNSPRRDNPFVKINCAAIPESLLESELFGHRKGSFTGAVADKKGKFEISDGGTIFLDEIGDLDMNLQSKLLRVLQEREIEPIGGRTRKVDIRVIAATNANLEEKIVLKEFREDLYYRLNVIHLRIPALRERREDILLLVQHFIEKYKKENNKDIRGVSPAAVQLLENYDWPGNVRQLENIIERSLVMCQHDFLDLEDFQDATLPFMEMSTAAVRVETPVRQAVLENNGNGNGNGSAWPERNLPDDDLMDEMSGKVYSFVISEVEKRLILMALKKFRYTKTQAARFLGINRNTLDKKIRELKIDY